MKMKKLSKLLSLLLLVGMLFSMLPATALAADGDQVWTRVEPTAIAEGDTVTITMTTADGNTYALSNAPVSKNPTAPSVTVDGDTMTADNNDAISWSMAVVDGGYTFTHGSYTLNYGNISTAQSVRVSTDAAAVWTLNGNYLSTTDGSTTRYLGVWVPTNGSTPTWRHYDGTTNQIKNQVVSFWKLGGGETP